MRTRDIGLVLASCWLVGCSAEPGGKDAGLPAGSTTPISPSTTSVATSTIAPATSATTSPQLQAAPPPTASTTAVATSTGPTTTLPFYDLSIPSTCEIGATLRLSDTGGGVRCLQLRLNQITPGTDSATDGVFGTVTDNQIRLFQAVHNLTVDGIVGEQTAGLLDIWNPPPPAPPPAQVQPVVAQSNVYYANCSAARAAGAAPIYRGEPGYRSALDRDDDGVACE